MKMKFEDVYKEYVYDVCTHCNLYQVMPTYIKCIDLGQTYAYGYKCQHCYQIYVAEIKKENLLKLGRDIQTGYNNFIIPGYEEEPVRNYFTKKIDV